QGVSGPHKWTHWRNPVELEPLAAAPPPVDPRPPEAGALQPFNWSGDGISELLDLVGRAVRDDEPPRLVMRWADQPPTTFVPPGGSITSLPPPGARPDLQLLATASHPSFIAVASAPPTPSFSSYDRARRGGGVDEIDRRAVPRLPPLAPPTIFRPPDVGTTVPEPSLFAILAAAAATICTGRRRR
ncbi:MAG TPA: hypothetical protein VK324_13565, partial [Tepidisphaeraceae bacterium]|nr:hypothetical protein [Tepidisphaeraceae bacterium]